MESAAEAAATTAAETTVLSLHGQNQRQAGSQAEEVKLVFHIETFVWGY
jgi:hypothetical protein